MDEPRMAAAPYAPEAEKRYATVVKCDVVDSTSIGHQLDLDGQLAFKHGWEALVIGVASRYGGRIERFEGDGALISFGAPEAREDAPESALRMALELVEATSAATFVPGVQLQIRVGVASGMVAVLKKAHAASEGIAGITIALAERLRASAEPGQVVISDATKRLAGRFFHYNDLGRMRLKGFGETVIAWRVMRKSVVASRFQAQRSTALQGPIVGRGAAQTQLEAAWKRVAAGEGQAVCLIGDAGFGKSRLARSIMERAAGDAAVVLETDCSPSARNTPLYPIGVLLQRVAGIRPDSTPEDSQVLAAAFLARYLPNAGPEALAYLAPLFGVVDAPPPPANTNPAEIRDRTIEAVVGMLHTLAEDGPLALLCEDLHWIDDTTAALISRVHAELPRLRALLVVTTRPPADALPVDLANFPTIELEELAAPMAAELIRSLAHGEKLGETEIHRIIERGEGVPLVIEELTRNALEADRSGPIAAGAQAGSALPTTLELVVQSRMSRRPRMTPLVQAAAVLGREFSLRLLERMVPEADREDVGRSIESLIHDGLLAPPDSGEQDRAQFKHAMIWEAVYETLLGADRQRLHSHAADTLLLEQRGTPDAAPDVLAEHLRKAKRFPEAIEMRLAASGDTVSRGAYVEAEGHCQAALEMIDGISDGAARRTTQFKLLAQLGVALAGRHGYASPKVEDAYRRAQAVCGESAEAEMLYPVMRGLTALNLVRGNLAAGFELSTQAMALAEQSKRPEFRIDALSVHCYATMYFGTLAECRSWILRCLALYEQEGGGSLTYPVPNDAGTAALAILPTIEWLLGDAEGCEAAIQRGLAHVEGLNRAFDRAYLHAWIAGVRTTQRRHREAMENAGIAIGISEKNGYREWHVTGLLIHLLGQAELQPSPQALEQAGQVCAGLAAEGVGLNASWYLWELARGFRQLGEPGIAIARKLVGDAFLRAQASAETRMDSELLLLQAELEPDAAVAGPLLRQSLAAADAQGAVINSLRAAAALVVLGGKDPAAVGLARTVRDVLEGRAPVESNAWIRDSLATLRKAL